MTEEVNEFYIGKGLQLTSFDKDNSPDLFVEKTCNEAFWGVPVSFENTRGSCKPSNFVLLVLFVLESKGLY